MAPEPSVDRTPDDSLARVLRVGGMSKGELLKELSDNGIQLNEIGRSLFADDRFLTSAASSVMETVQTSVAGLGFTQGATFAEIEASCEHVGDIAGFDTDVRKTVNRNLVVTLNVPASYQWETFNMMDQSSRGFVMFRMYVLPRSALMDGSSDADQIS